MADAAETPEMIIANSILRNNCVCTLRETDELCNYNGGVFHRGKIALSEVRAQITDLASVLAFPNARGEPRAYNCTISKRNEILETIKTKSFRSINEFDAQPNRVNVRNGHLHFKEKKEDFNFVEHFKHNESPYLSFIQLPLVYDPDAECLEIDQFLEDVFGFYRVSDIYELLAYFIMPTIKYQKAFIFYGPPQTGKTSTINLIIQFLGGENWHRVISQVRLQDLGKRFQLANLRGKLLNVFDDLRKNKIMYRDAFQQVVTNSYLSSEVKNVQGDVTWRNTTKQLYTCNDLPEITKDVGFEFWRRWMLYDCFNEFSGKDRDLKIENKRWPQEELSGLLNKCIEAWYRLEARGHFRDDDVEHVKGMWQMDINPVKLFANEKCEFNQEYEVDYSTMWREVNKFRREKNAKDITKKMCTSSLQRIKDYIEVKKRGNGDKYYKGVRLNYAAEVELDEDKGQKKLLDEYYKDVDYSDPNRYM